MVKNGKQLNLQNIAEFIQTGGDTDLDKHGFTERLEKAHRDLRKYIETTCGNEKTDDILEKIILYSSIVQDIYFSVGMKAGAKIIIQLTNNFETDF
jgi:hypothetical protein